MEVGEAVKNQLMGLLGFVFGARLLGDMKAPFKIGMIANGLPLELGVVSFGDAVDVEGFAVFFV